MLEDAPAVQPETQAGVATAEGGYVILDGPDGVAVTMTPEAASLTAERLLAAASAAERQKTL